MDTATGYMAENRTVQPVTLTSNQHYGMYVAGVLESHNEVSREQLRKKINDAIHEMSTERL